MAKVKTIETVTGTTTISGKTFQVKEVIQQCERCESTDVATEGGNKVSGWTCWDCEVSYDKPSKQQNKGINTNFKKQKEVSLDERAETIEADSDMTFLSFDDNLNMVELKLFIEQLNTTDKRKQYLKDYVKHGSLQTVANIHNVKVQTVDEALKTIKGYTKEEMKKLLI